MNTYNFYNKNEKLLFLKREFQSGMSLTPTGLSRATMSRNFGEKELLAETALRNTGIPPQWTETMDLDVNRHRKERKQTGK